MIKKIHVELGEKSYAISIQPRLGDDISFLKSSISSEQVAIVTDEKIAPIYLKKISNAFKEKKVIEIILPEGEPHKTLEQFSTIIDTLIEHHFTRSATLIALGGGVIGDLTGFAAACYQRGIDYIQMPTTLLAQVDAAIGGKTAVNHPRAKNMIGVFHQPKAVFIDPNFLHTLPERDYHAGLAEVIKYGLIWDADFCKWLLAHRDAIFARELSVLTTMIHRCCEIKAEIITQDETDRGLRQLLNFGHTFGHAIEATLGYDRILHGEAVALGMREAILLSNRQEYLGAADTEFALNLLQAFDFQPYLFKEGERKAWDTAMRHDKKRGKSMELRFILLERIGRAFSCSSVLFKVVDIPYN